MPMPEGYVKAKLAIEGGEEIQALFNPTEFTITKGNNWTFDPIKGTSLPKGKFGGGKPREMQVNLLLDQTLPNGGKTVKQITDSLFKMMEVPSGSGAGGAGSCPPLVTFQWGEMIPFKAACTSLTVAFQLFKANGSPIRADVKLALTQADTASSASSSSANKKTNPTTRSDGGLGIHVDPGRRLAAVDRPPHLRRPEPLAHGGRGERHRQPAAPAPRPRPRPPPARLMAGNSEHVAPASVKINGVALGDADMALVEKIEVRNYRGLPDMASIRMADPEGKRVADPPFKVGQAVEIKLGNLNAAQPAPVFVGEIVAYEPEFTSSAAMLSFRALDKSHRLQRGRKNRTFQKMSASDIVTKVVQENGLPAGTSTRPRRARVRPAEHGVRPRLPQPARRGREPRVRRRGQQGVPAQDGGANGAATPSPSGART